MPDRAEFPIPAVIDPPARRCLCIPVPDHPDHIHVFAGLLQELTYWFNWERDSSKSGKDVARVWRDIYNALDWSTMSCCCGQNSFPVRVNEDGTIEYSPDGGVTWFPYPQGDPRINATRFTPLPGDDGADKRCKAATNVTGHLKEQADKLIADSGAWGNITEAVTILLELLLFIGVIGSGGALAPILIALAGVLLSVGSSAFDAAMTADVWDTLNCIIYCHTKPDGSYDQNALDRIHNDVIFQLTGVAVQFINQNLLALGVVGVSNMATVGTQRVFDCSECECPQCGDNFDIWDRTSEGVPADFYGVILSRADDYIEVRTDTGYWTLTTNDLDTCCFIGSIEVISGSATGTAWNGCGEPFTGAFAHTTTPINNCAWIIEFQGAAGSIIKIHFGGCS